MQLDKIKDQSPIAMLRTAVWRDIKIAGRTVRVHKPKARQAAMVAQRLMESFGETLVRIFSNPDSELRKAFSDDNIGSEDMFRLMFAGGFLKTAMERLRELGHEIGDDHLFWYFEALLPNNVSIDGHRLTSIDEMDDHGFGFLEFMKMMQITVELAIYPTSDDPGTDAGKSDPKSEQQTQSAVPAKKAQRAKKRRGGTNKAGQSVQMSARSG